MIKIGLFTDVHYDPENKSKSSKGIKGKESVKYFPSLVNKLIKIKPCLIVNLGDLIESNPTKSFRDISTELRRLHCPIFHVIGNHELELFSLPKLKKMFGIKSSYYSKEICGYKLIFLNTFDRKASKPDYRRKSRIIGGKISKRQLSWLKEELKKSKFPVIVFSHKALCDLDLKKNQIWKMAPPRYTKVENSSEVREILENSKKVISVFQGHVHQNSMKVLNKIPYFTIQGFCQNKDYSNKGQASRSFAVISIKKREIEIEIHGDKKSLHL